MIEVTVSGLAMDGTTKTPMVLLKETHGDRWLPIWIGPAEANAIAIALEGSKIERPLTHDLMKSIIEGLKAKITKVEVTELKDNTFYAKIYLERDSSIVAIDARPSDSIALALRGRVSIYVAEEVMNSSSTHLDPDDESKAEALRNYLQRLNPEDFGDYKI